MKNTATYILSGLLIVLAFVACKKNPAPDFHYDYFNLGKGNYVIYDVVEITHDDDLNQHDTVMYQLKTVWGDPYIDNEGRNATQFNRYTRNSSNDPWQFSDLWTGIIDGVRGEIVEENQRVVKLIFAPTLQKSWDANAYNIMPLLECYYRDIHQDTIVGGVAFDSTLVVEQAEVANAIDTIRKFEVYANNVGLVYKYSRDLNFQYDANGFPYLNEGKEIFYTYVSSGVE